MGAVGPRDRAPDGDAPYSGTEIWHTEARELTTRDYRLFDIQHAVQPLAQFYRELVATQAVINRKHLGMAALAQTARIVAGHLARRQTNFARMLWKFGQTYNAERQLADHTRPVHYELPVPDQHTVAPRERQHLYVHTVGRRPGPAPATPHRKPKTTGEQP